MDWVTRVSNFIDQYSYKWAQQVLVLDKLKIEAIGVFISLDV
jgi:hypothetical protein